MIPNKAYTFKTCYFLWETWYISTPVLEHLNTVTSSNKISFQCCSPKYILLGVIPTEFLLSKQEDCSIRKKCKITDRCNPLGPEHRLLIPGSTFSPTRFLFIKSPSNITLILVTQRPTFINQKWFAIFFFSPVFHCRLCSQPELLD